MTSGNLARVAFYFLLFIAAVFELAGCDSFWRWLHERRTWLWMVPGILAYVAYGALQARQPQGFGRVYAMYGGVFVAASVGWGWLREGNRPDTGDLVGSAVCILGSLIIQWWPRT
jgi:small multidrug resistance family-3 protein